MARYIGPKSKIARKFQEPIYGHDKFLEKKKYAPGMHGLSKRRRKVSEYGIQLAEKQKAMEAAAKNLDFIKAAKLRDEIKGLKA